MIYIYIYIYHIAIEWPKPVVADIVNMLNHMLIYSKIKNDKTIHNTITKNPNENINYEELYLYYCNDINRKAKEYREYKKNDEEYMKNIREQKLTWYNENKQQVNYNRKLKRDNQLIN